MKLITQRVLIQEVAARWYNQYYPFSRHSPNKEEKYIQLRQLDGDTATADEVKKIIGNTSWTRVPKCDECGAEPPAVVRIGEPPDYESSTATICLKCLVKAAKLCIAIPSAT